LQKLDRFRQSLDEDDPLAKIIRAYVQGEPLDEHEASNALQDHLTKLADRFAPLAAKVLRTHVNPAPPPLGRARQ
jgi:hypothetical protein